METSATLQTRPRHPLGASQPKGTLSAAARAERCAAKRVGGTPTDPRAPEGPDGLRPPREGCRTDPRRAPSRASQSARSRHRRRCRLPDLWTALWRAGPRALISSPGTSAAVFQINEYIFMIFLSASGASIKSMTRHHRQYVRSLKFELTCKGLPQKQVRPCESISQGDRLQSAGARGSPSSRRWRGRSTSTRSSQAPSPGWLASRFPWQLGWLAAWPPGGPAENIPRVAKRKPAGSQVWPRPVRTL